MSRLEASSTSSTAATTWSGDGSFTTVKDGAAHKRHETTTAGHKGLLLSECMWNCGRQDLRLSAAMVVSLDPVVNPNYDYPDGGGAPTHFSESLASSQSQSPPGLFAAPFYIFLACFATIVLVYNCVFRRHLVQQRRRLRSGATATCLSPATHNHQSIFSTTTSGGPPSHLTPTAPYTLNGPPQPSSVAVAAAYPMFVPPAFGAIGAQQLLRDPRHFGGIVGFQAPPAYPPPPTYAQVMASTTVHGRNGSAGSRLNRDEPRGDHSRTTTSASGMRRASSKVTPVFPPVA